MEAASPPLESAWVERPLTVTAGGRTFVGTARANWGAVEVEVTEPIAHLSRKRDCRGWTFAMACHHRPGLRFALSGAFTPRGVEAAEGLLADLCLDWLAIVGRGTEVDAACRKARRQLAESDAAFAARTAPLLTGRTELRRSFKAGSLTSPDYQARLRELSLAVEDVDRQRREAGEAVRERFADWCATHCGRRVSLDEAETLLSEAAVVVPARAVP
jgi:hypothetical protein